MISSEQKTIKYIVEGRTKGPLEITLNLKENMLKISMKIIENFYQQLEY